MQNLFSQHIDKKFPFLKKGKLLVACSGGVDSVVLAHLLCDCKIQFDLAHCNYGLRGKESDEDQKFVEQLGRDFDCRVFGKKFDLKGLQGSVQLKARNLRYDWFDELLHEHGYEYLLTAHHADDSLETFLINLSRGTGIEGLTGIPEQNGNNIRPLLPFSRQQILTYAQDQNISWREDSSNTETKYLRNKIRHEIVPNLKNLHPTFLQNFQTTQEYLKQSHIWIESHAKSVQQTIFIKGDNPFKINIKDLKEKAKKDFFLFFLFKTYGFTNTKDLSSLLTAESGKELRSKTHRLVKDREHLLLAPILGNSFEVFEINEGQNYLEHPLHLTMEEVDAIADLSQNTIYVDKETLNYPLLIRKRENGDYFYPFGMKGKKKVAKFFKDEKIDILSKEKQWLLCSGSDVVWIIGLRADERFKVTGDTKQIIKFTCIE